MIISKSKNQKMGVIANTQPDLWKSIKALFPDDAEEQQGKIAGVVIEFVIKSGGDVRVFDGTEEEEDVTEFS